MTREEAARILDPETTWYELWKYEAETHLAVCDEACRMGADALRAQQEREDPKPLTLDELRQMAQKCEGVYVVHTDGTPVFRGQKYCAAALDFSPAFGSYALHVHAIYGDRLTLWEDDYGKTWLAYRYKPKEGKV